MNIDNDVKRFNAQKYYLPKWINVNCNVIINGKTRMTKPLIDSDTKLCEEIRKLTTTVLGEVYTTRCLLDYDYIKN